VQDLRDAVAVVLGAERAPGFALSEACRERGMRVVVDAKPQEVGQIEDLGLVINATRFGHGSNAWETSWRDWKETMDVNLGRSLQLCRVAAPLVTVCWSDAPNAPFFTAQRSVLAFQQNLSLSRGRAHALFVDGGALKFDPEEFFTRLAQDRFYLGLDTQTQLQARLRLESLRQCTERPWLKRGGVAVVTGAAGGIGLALARRCLAEGMKVVLSDVHPGDLERAAQGLPESEILSVVADVARPEQVERLAELTLKRFGAVHLLVNNAGVGAGGSPLESTPNDWEWVMGVNFWGVVAAAKVFVPLLLSQGEPAHILNTASLAGLLAYHPSVCYHVSKHAVVALSESLRDSLRDSCIGVLVLCPGYVNTRILSSSRNRPEHLRDEDRPPPRHLRLLQASLRKGLAPEEVAERALEGMREGRFYLFTHPEMLAGVEENLRDLLQLRNPRNPNRLNVS